MTRASTPARQQPQQAAPPARPSRDLRQFLEGARDRLAEALPQHLGPDKLIQLVASMAYENRKLAECDQGSVLASVLKAASLGLDLTSGMMEGYLIPRWNKGANCTLCTFMVGYQGLVKLARQGGSTDIRSAIIHAEDVFSYAFDPDLQLSHAPAFPHRGPIVGVYATGKTPTGKSLIEVMNVEEVEKVRARSQSPNEGPWVTDWSEMARKTVLKRLCKSLPRSVELQRAINLDNEDYEDADDYRGTVQVSAAVPRQLGSAPTRAAALGAKLAAQRPAPEPEFTSAESVETPLRSEEEAPAVEPEDDLGVEVE